MKPFEYVRARTVDEAIRGLGENSRFLAGGTNLVDLMRYGVETADRLVDLTHLPLKDISNLPDGGLRIGAMVRNSDLAADRRVATKYPLLSQALLNGASPQLRNMATVGGNLLQRTRCYYFYDTALPCNKRAPGTGCPAIEGYNRIHAILGQSESCIAVHPSDMCVALAALDAVVHVKGPAGRRELPILEFHRLPGSTPEVDTNLKPGELIVAVDVPHIPEAARSTYIKVRDRNSYAFALVSVAAAVQVEGSAVRAARIALGGVAHKPWRAVEAERALVGQMATLASFKAAADAALSGAIGYKHNEFKIELAKRTIVRALADLTGATA